MSRMDINERMDRVFEQRWATPELCDSDRNILADLAHESCEAHCEDCGTCDWEPTGPTTERKIPMTEIDHGHSISAYCPDCLPDTWKPETDPADGYNPSPELRVEHDGLALTIQRSHLTDDHAIYYWSITTDGTLVPLVDGTLTSYEPEMALTRVAGHLAWHWYHRDMPNVLAMWGWPAIHIHPATTRTPNANQRATLRIIHAEALT